MYTFFKYKTALLLMLCTSIMAHAQQQLLVTVMQRTDSVAIIDINKSQRLATLPVGDMPHEITYDPVTQRCFISNFGVEDYDTRIGIPGCSITVVDPFQQKVITTIQTGFGAVGNMPHGVKVRPGKRELFVNIERTDSMLVYDLDTYKEINRFVLPKGTHNFIFSNQGNRLWLVAGAGGVYEVAPQNGKIKAHKLFQTPIRGLTFLTNNILASGLNELYLLEPKKLETVHHYQHLGVGQILYSAVTQDERFILCPAPFDATVVVVDTQTGRVVKRIPTDKTPINIQVTDRFAFVSHAQDNHITQLDLRTFAISKLLHVAGTNGLLIISKPMTTVSIPPQQN